LLKETFTGGYIMFGHSYTSNVENVNTKLTYF
jgi:hypothetical protein